MCLRQGFNVEVTQTVIYTIHSVKMVYRIGSLVKGYLH